MTKLDGILKSRDITLPTMVLLVKAMVFPVVMYECESWTVKKAERRRIVFFFFLSEKSFIPIRNTSGYRILGICGSIEHKREQNQ